MHRSNAEGIRERHLIHNPRQIGDLCLTFHNRAGHTKACTVDFCLGAGKEFLDKDF